jgi:electron transfer flavoprotein beta subunit
LNIVVCVKQTPDTAATVSVQNGVVSWGEAPLVLNPWDEYAVEEALRVKEAQGGKVTAISLGPQGAKEALKQALAIGCDEAVLLSDPAFEAADSLVASQILATAIRKLEGTELAFFGRQAVDSDTGVTGAQVARRLGWPSLSLVSSIAELNPTARSITVERLLEEGRQIVRSALPAALSVVKEINEPRYPSFMGIRRASRAEIPVWSAADLELPSTSAALSWAEILPPPRLDTTCEFIDGSSPQEIASRLVTRLVEEKVL